MLSFYNEGEYFVIVDVSTERAFSSKSSPGPIMCHLDVSSHSVSPFSPDPSEAKGSKEGKALT